jgi:hypothetical protein
MTDDTARFSSAVGSAGVTAELRETWQNDGLIVLPRLITEEQVTRHLALVAAVRAEVPNGRDEYGLGDRIGQLHQKLPELIDTVASERLLAFLKYALEDEPLVFASLNFERGTQQEVHVDLIYFCTEPLHAMVGVWIALEDISIDAGPLFYHLGSHHWPFEYQSDVHSDGVDVSRPAAGAELGSRAKAWLERLASRVAERGSPKKPMVLRKGDAVVWHARLAHGGMPRVAPELSRKSVVYHFIGKGSKLFTYEEFFTYPKDELLRRNGVSVPIKTRGIVEYQSHPYFVTYDGGKELVHPIQATE